MTKESIVLTTKQKEMIERFLGILLDFKVETLENIRIFGINDNVFYFSVFRNGKWSFPVQSVNGKLSVLNGFEIPTRTFNSLRSKGLIIKQEKGYIFNYSYLTHDYFVKLFGCSKGSIEFYYKHYSHLFGELNLKDKKTKSYEIIKVIDVDDKILNEIIEKSLYYIYEEITTPRKNSNQDKLLIKRDKFSKEILGAVIYSVSETKALNIIMIEINKHSKNKGVASKIINSLILGEKATSIYGDVKNTYEAFSFWQNIGEKLGQEIDVYEEDLEYLNEEEYDFEYIFSFKINGGK